MKKLFFLFSLMLLSCCLKAQDNNYAVAGISKQLLHKANAVLRVNEETFTVKSAGKGKLNVKRAYTILNPQAKDLGNLTLDYSDLSKIGSINGSVYDASGKQVGKIKKSDIKDFIAFDGVAFVSDNRVKQVELHHHSYPYTVEFEYEIIYDGLLFYPNWNPYSVYRPDISVEKTSFVVVAPNDLSVRYKEYNLESYKNFQEQKAVSESISSSGADKNSVKISKEDKETTYKWQLQNLSIFKQEAFGLAWWSSRPFVRIAPTQFEIEGYQGNMASWEDLGKFIYQLNKGRDVLPEATINKVKEMTKDLKSPVEKTQAIYEYMQSKTRYVGIQLGIGGWQPFPAQFVDEKGYGDCKALTNYTKAMLDAIGIQSFYTLVTAGEYASPIDKSFPAANFNHAFLCVPMEKDTVWLECTSQTQAFGYAGDFTGDREVLLITPDGGRLVHTVTYKQNDNLLNRKASVIITHTGDATSSITTQYKALQEGSRSYLSEQSEEIQKKWLYEKLDIPTFEITSFSIKRVKQRIPFVEETLELKMRKLASKSGQRLFIKPNLLNKWSYIPDEEPNRTQDIYLNSNYDFEDKDEIAYFFPKEYQLEYLPSNINISSRFGTYQATFEVVENKLTYTRTLKMQKGLYPANSFAELVDFYKQIVKADQAKVVLVEGK